MRLGLQISNFTWPGGPSVLGETFRRIAVDADSAGLDSLWVMDHFFQIRGVGPAENDMLEGYLALAHAAAVTERISLGTLVTGVTYRHPGLLAKTVTTLDVLSGGRAWLGIGAAWNEEEHRGLGVPFPPVAERFERLEETLQIADAMWSGDEKPYAGKHYTLERTLNSPQSLSRPRPRVMVGGMGERKTLRLVAQYADACNFFDVDPATVRHKLDVLRGHCDDVGRPFDEIEKTILLRAGLAPPEVEGARTVEQAAQEVARVAELGFDHAILSLPAPEHPSTGDLLAELVRRVGAA